MLTVGRLVLCGPIRKYRCILVEHTFRTYFCCRLVKAYRVIFWAQNMDRQEFCETVDADSLEEAEAIHKNIENSMNSMYHLKNQELREAIKPKDGSKSYNVIKCICGGPENLPCGGRCDGPCGGPCATGPKNTSQVLASVGPQDLSPESSGSSGP